MNGRAILAWNLRTLRTAQNLSQERLAADAGIDRAYISDIERKSGNVSIDVLDKIVAVLEIPIGALFAEVPEGASDPPVLQGGRPRKT